MLEDEGFSTAAAGNGSEALAWLDAHHQQTGVVLLDLMMPVMNGQQFLVAKEARPALAGVPVVVITASGAESCDQILRGHRVRGCLSKPISLPQLLAMVGSPCQR